MWKSERHQPLEGGVIAVLGAAAAEAEELLLLESDLDLAAADEAKRRLKMFMDAVRQTTP